MRPSNWQSLNTDLLKEFALTAKLKERNRVKSEINLVRYQTIWLFTICMGKPVGVRFVQMVSNNPY